MERYAIRFDASNYTIRIEDEIDAFKLPIHSKPVRKSVQNSNRHQLVALIDDTREMDSRAEFKPYANRDDKGATFFLHRYRETGPHNSGIAVLFTVTVDDINYIMYSTDDSSVRFKAGVVPQEIPSATSEFIFYQKTFSVGHDGIRFESSMKQNHYLSFSKENHELILLHCPPDEETPNETIKMYIF